MTRYNTGNPVGSSSPLDLYDNAENLDAGINGPSPTWRDRRGQTRKSWAGVESDFVQFLADGSTIEFPTWAAAASAAGAGQIPVNRQVAVIGDAGTHVDPVSGLAVPNSGRFVRVPAGLQFRSPDVLTQKADTTYVDLEDAVIRRPLNQLVGVEPTNGALPLGLINDDGSFPVGVDIATGNLLARIPADNPGLTASLNRRFGQIDPDSRMFLYDGQGPVLPILINEHFQILDGINLETGERVGNVPSGAARYPPTPLRDLAIDVVPQLSDWNHVIVYGQSLALGATSIPPISTVSKYDHLTFVAGPRATKSGSTGSNPGTDFAVKLFENTLAADGQANRGETPSSGLANAFTTYAARENGLSPASAILFVSAPGHGNYSLSQLDMGSAWVQVLKDHVTEARRLAVAAGKTYAVVAVPWIQGEADSSTVYESYRSRLVAFRTALCAWIRGVTGQAFDPIFINYQTPNNGALDGQISRAQLDVAMHDDGFGFGGPIYHLQSTDGIHVDNRSSYRMGWALGRALKQYLIDKKQPAFIRPLAAVRSGNRVSWRFDVPQPPLQIDVSALPPTQDYGFRVNDGTGAALLIESVVVENGDTVVLTLAGYADAATEVRYALDYLGTGTAWNDEETGNLRDSSTGRCEVAGQSYPTWHVAPSCRANIINLGE